MVSKENKIIYKDEFDKIWVDIFLPLFNEFCHNYGLKHTYIRYIELKIWSNYNSLRDLFIKKYMRYDIKNIDRHKIAACMLKAIIKAKPFYIPLNIRFKILLTKMKLNQLFKVDELYVNEKNINNYIFYANEYLALSVAISIIDGYIQADKEKPIKHQMILPDPFPDDDPNYLLDICIDLHFSGLRKMNVATFANVFFLWEKYSCRRKQCENLEEQCKRLLIKCGECQSNDEKELEDMIKDIRFGKYIPIDDINNTTDKEQ